MSILTFALLNAALAAAAVAGLAAVMCLPLRTSRPVPVEQLAQPESRRLAA